MLTTSSHCLCISINCTVLTIFKLNHSLSKKKTKTPRRFMNMQSFIYLNECGPVSTIAEKLDRTFRKLPVNLVNSLNKMLTPGTGEKVAFWAAKCLHSYGMWVTRKRVVWKTMRRSSVTLYMYINISYFVPCETCWF